MLVSFEQKLGSEGESGFLGVALRGSLRDEGARTVILALQRRWAAHPDHLAKALVDLRGASDCDTATIPGLKQLHRFLSERVDFVVYLSDKAKTRGVLADALRLAPDDPARIAMTEDQARGWLSGSFGRVRDARRRTASLVQAIEESLARRKSSPGQ